MGTVDVLDKFGNCYVCRNKENVPGNCHISCVKPDTKMTGNPHGIKKGWFMYPLLFDPIWRTKKCDNFESTDARKSGNQSTSESK